MATSEHTELSVQGESLQQLYNLYISDRFLVNRRYQRKLVWATSEKARLVDSVLKRLPIPLVLLAETSQGGSAKTEIIDGLQRLNALFAFIENEYSVPDGGFFDLETLADTKYARDEGRLTQKYPVLPRDACLAIVNYQLPVSTYRSASESDVDEVFRRINSSGRHLSLQEIRQAGNTLGIATLVRRLSAGVRGDASLTDYVSLSGMPSISITDDETASQGIYDGGIPWVQQGILSREAVRESRDEELVLDIVLDLLLSPMAGSGVEYRNAAYGNGGQGIQSANATLVASRLALITAEEVERRFNEVFSLLEALMTRAQSSYAAWTVTQQNPRGIPRYFHAMFVAIARLMYDDHKIVGDPNALANAIKGFWDRDLSIPSGGRWGSERKTALINSVKGTLAEYFVPAEDEVARRLDDQAAVFESTLRMSLTENAMFELKQGFNSLREPGRASAETTRRVIKAATAMANAGPAARGVVYFGVADDASDAVAVQSQSGVTAAEVDGGRFFVTGTQHELTAMGRSVDEHFRWLSDIIRSSPIDADFATLLIESLAPFRYKEYLLWRLEPASLRRPLTYGDRFYVRSGPSTVEVTGTALISLMSRFPA